MTRALRTDIPRSSFDQDLSYSFGAFMTVCTIRRNNAEARIRAMLSGDAPAPVEEREGEPDVEAAEFDIEQLGRDPITTHILQKFKEDLQTELPLKRIWAGPGGVVVSASGIHRVPAPVQRENEREDGLEAVRTSGRGWVSGA